MRDYEIYIPSDCVASECDERTRATLLFAADAARPEGRISPSKALELESLVSVGHGNQSESILK